MLLAQRLACQLLACGPRATRTPLVTLSGAEVAAEAPPAAELTPDGLIQVCAGCLSFQRVRKPAARARP
eukprot:7345779-Prymnesium_polylepis.1